TLLWMTDELTAPSSRIPPPWNGGLSSPGGQNRLLACATLSWTDTSPTPPGSPSSRTKIPWQFPETLLNPTSTLCEWRTNTPNTFAPLTVLPRTIAPASGESPTYSPASDSPLPTALLFCKIPPLELKRANPYSP